MNQVLVVDNNRVRSAEDIQMVDQILKLKDEGNHWGVIDFLVKAWMKKVGDDEVEAFRVEVNDQREVLFDTKFGQTKGGKDYDRRLTLIFPQKLMLMIRAVYKPDELSMDSNFYKDFLKKYPSFRIATKD